MRKIDLEDLTVDPITATLSEIEGEVAILAGYVREKCSDSIKLCRSRSSKSYVDVSRRDVIAAFADETTESLVVLLVRQGAEVKSVEYATLDKDNCRCDGNQDGGVIAKDQLPSWLRPEVEKVGGVSIFPDFDNTYGNCLLRGGDPWTCFFLESEARAKKALGYR